MRVGRDIYREEHIQIQIHIYIYIKRTGYRYRCIYIHIWSIDTGSMMVVSPTSNCSGGLTKKTRRPKDIYGEEWMQMEIDIYVYMGNELTPPPLPLTPCSGDLTKQ